MRSFLTVLKFEYTGMVKPKSFKITTIIFAILLLAAACLPMIMGFFRNDGGDDAYYAYIDGGQPAAFYDATGLYTEDVLAAFAPEHTWVRFASREALSTAVEAEEFDLGLYFTGDGLVLYMQGSDALFGAHPGRYWEMTRSILQANQLEAAGLDMGEIGAVLGIEPQMEVITLGRDASQGYWVTLVLSLLLFMCIQMYLAFVVHSVSTEKTSKAIELLTISASPYALMFGKVIGVGLVGLTQIVIALVPAVVALHLNIDAWMEFSPMVAMIFEMVLSSNILPLALLIFVLGFFTFSFLAAAFASTASRAEDVSSTQTLISLLLVIAYYVSFSGIFAPGAAHIQILSFVPFFSPLVLLTRIGMEYVPMWELLLSLSLSLIYMLLLGFLSAKIYRIGVMMTGNKPSIKRIFKMLRQA